MSVLSGLLNVGQIWQCVDLKVVVVTIGHSRIHPSNKNPRPESVMLLIISSSINIESVQNGNKEAENQRENLRDVEVEQHLQNVKQRHEK